MEENSERTLVPVVDKVTPKLLVVLLFLLPFFVVPTSAIGVEFSKTILLVIGVMLALISWGIHALRTAEIRVPHSWATIFIVLLPVVYFVSALAGPSTRISLIGHNLAIDSVLGVLSLALLAFLVASSVRKQKTLFQYFAAIFISLLIVALVHIIRLIGGVDVLTLNTLVSSVSSIIGKWNDMALLFGLGAIASVISLATLPPKKTLQVITYITLVVSVVFLAIINFVPAWYAVGIFSLLLLVYGLSSRKSQKARMKISAVVASVVLVAVSIVFLFAGPAIGGSISESLGVSHVEVRPDWDATISVVDESLKDAAALGAGPNRFSAMWLMHKPDGINETAFWQVEFNSGFGTIPSAPATVGLVGLGSWVLLLGLMLVLSVRVVFNRKLEGLPRFMLTTSAVSVIYLTVFMFIYTPGVVLRSLTFVFFGLLLAGLYVTGLKKPVVLNLPERPTANFIITFVLIVVVVFGILGVYAASERIAGETLYQKGLASVAAGDLEDGQRSILRATQFYPSDVYHRALSVTYIGELNRIVRDQETPQNLLISRFQETLGNAIAAARRAIEIDPANYANHVSLGDVYSSVVPLGIDGALENATASYKEAVVYNPSPEIYLAQARIEAASGSATRARAFIGKAIEEKSNYVEAVFLLAQIQIAEGNVREAIRSVEIAAAVSPNNPATFFQLGVLKYGSADYTGAVAAFESAVALSPVYANAKYFLGLSYYQVGQVERAIEQFEGLRETNPNNAEVIFILDNLVGGREPFANVEPPLDAQPVERDSLPIEETEEIDEVEEVEEIEE